MRSARAAKLSMTSVSCCDGRRASAAGRALEAEKARESGRALFSGIEQFLCLMSCIEE
jgi:hypothetical protein